jgi:hypothetical protein
MQTEAEELLELHELNVQLMETLVLIGKRFFDYTEKYRIEIDGMAGLSSLIGRAVGILDEIGTPYHAHANPIISDARSDDKRPPDKLPVYPREGFNT